MAQRILNNNDYANDFRTKINDNFTELFGNNVPKNHAVNADTYGLGTTSLYGHVRVQASNGLSINAGTIMLSAASTNGYGSARLASSTSSTSPTDVVTSKLLSDALRGQSAMPKIFYGTTDPTGTNPVGSVDGDIYIKYS